MKTEDYLSYIVEKIHTTIVATVDDAGHPVTTAIDMMDNDENSLYFLTAKGKSFYNRLKNRNYLALTAIKGSNTINSVAISIQGKVKELGNNKIPSLFEKNPYMYKIYPTEKSMQALTVFQIYEGSGEWFDLSKTPIERATFTFGNADKKTRGYFITNKCIGCGSCLTSCPQNCIIQDKVPFIIQQEHCLHCGNCITTCPANAITYESNQ